MLVPLLQQNQQIVAAVPALPGAGAPFGGGGRSLGRWLAEPKPKKRLKRREEDEEDDELLALMC